MEEEVAFIRNFEQNGGRLIRDLTDDELAPLGWRGFDDAILERRFAEVTDGWAGSSGDTSRNAIALQEMASAKFGVSTDSMHFGLDALHATYRGEFGSGPAAFRKEVEALLAKDGPVLEAYLDASYEMTQRYLAEAGVDEVVLVRGMRFGGSGNPPIPEALRGMQPPSRGADFDALPDSNPSARYGESKVVQAIGNPLQSWSTVPAISERFANGGDFGAMMQARVGAGRILSFPATGPGCTNEFEWVVIGMDDVPVTLSRIR
jgi:hypothetical protein